MQERIAIVDGVRSPFCKAGGVLKKWHADDLGTLVLKELLARMPVERGEIDEVILGCCNQPVEAANVARVVALKAGLPKHVPAFSVHRNCASGMESISTGINKIFAGEANMVIAGGTESMSNAPLLFGDKMVSFFMRLSRSKSALAKLKTMLSFRPSFLKPIISLEKALTDPVSGLIMGKTAELLARDWGINRDTQDAYALHSHQKAAAAIEAGRLQEEIIPIPDSPTFKSYVEVDDGPRFNQSMEALAKLRTVFDRYAGTVTAGNACQITDGAAALLLMRESKAKELGLEPLGYVRDHAYAALEAARMGLGPVYAMHKLFDKTGLTMQDFSLVEINEAFSTQVIACQRAANSERFAQEQLGRSSALGEIRDEVLNVNGGAVALGHPVGVSGTRLVLTMLKELKRRGENLGLASLCVGGGQGAAFALEVA